MLLSCLRILVPFLAIIGYSAFASISFKTPLSRVLITTTSFLGVAEFLSALTGLLLPGTLLILCTGMIAFMYSGFYYYCHWQHFPKIKQDLITIGYYVLFVVLIGLFAWGLRFRSIDDYSFWGVMSKYLFFFNHLPTNDSYLSPQFLTYIPGMACFHYLFYFALGEYSQWAGYLAQGVVLLSALMVLYDGEHRLRSFVQMALAYIILSLGSGAILGRMEVDAYVAAYIFAIAWLIFQRSRSMFFIIAMPILFLSLIKEVGLFFSVIMLIALMRSIKLNKSSLAKIVMILAALVVLKGMWLHHCHMYGFYSFARDIHLGNAFASLNPLKTHYHLVQILYLKALLFEKFDHIVGWPNLLTYGILAWLWYRLSQQMNPEQYQRASRLKTVFLYALLIYGMMIYWLQAIVFGVGSSLDHLLDFERYFNILLIPFTLFSAALYYETNSRDITLSWRHPSSIIILSIALIMLISGKIERTHRYYLKSSLDAMVQKVQQHLPRKKYAIVCLTHIPDPAYDTLLPLAYMFLPQHILSWQKDAPCDVTISLAEEG